MKYWLLYILNVLYFIFNLKLNKSLYNGIVHNLICLYLFMAHGKMSLLIPYMCIPTPLRHLCRPCHQMLLTLPRIYFFQSIHKSWYLFKSALKTVILEPHVHISIVILVIHIHVYFIMANFNDKQLQAIYVMCTCNRCIIKYRSHFAYICNSVHVV